MSILLVFRAARILGLQLTCIPTFGSGRRASVSLRMRNTVAASKHKNGELHFLNSSAYSVPRRIALSGMRKSQLTSCC